MRGAPQTSMELLNSMVEFPIYLWLLQYHLSVTPKPLVIMANVNVDGRIYSKKENSARTVLWFDLCHSKSPLLTYLALSPFTCLRMFPTPHQVGKYLLELENEDKDRDSRSNSYVNFCSQDLTYNRNCPEKMQCFYLLPPQTRRKNDGNRRDADDVL